MLRDWGIRGFGRLERLLLIFGISLVCIYLVNLAYSAVYSRARVTKLAVGWRRYVDHKACSC